MMNSTKAPEVTAMKKRATFRCQDLGLACDYEMTAEGDMELMKRIEGHMKTVHQMDANEPETRGKILKGVRYQ